MSNRNLKYEIGFCLGVTVSYMSGLVPKVDASEYWNDNQMSPELIDELDRMLVGLDIYRLRIQKAVEELKENGKEK